MKERAILNPARLTSRADRDPRAAYAFFYPKEKAWEPRRVEYDIASVQKRILDRVSRPACRTAGGGW